MATTPGLVHNPRELARYWWMHNNGWVRKSRNWLMLVIADDCILSISKVTYKTCQWWWLACSFMSCLRIHDFFKTTWPVPFLPPKTKTAMWKTTPTMTTTIHCCMLLSGYPPFIGDNFREKSSSTITVGYIYLFMFVGWHLWYTIPVG